jgi:hypothetical protein
MTTTEDHNVPTDLLEDAAQRMRGLDLSPSVVVPADEEANPLELAAEASAARALTGAIGVAYDILIDQLFSDLQTLTESGGSAAGNMVVVLDELPSQYEDRYTAGFLHRFLAVAFDLGQRMSTEYTGPSCVAQELVVELLLNQVGTVATAFEQ